MPRDLILQAIVSGLLMGLIYALVAVGLSLIFGLMEIVNFAHGEFLMLAMFTASTHCWRCHWWQSCSRWRESWCTMG
jgi:branched-subunit amino acid ABC-type transport system permease component